MIAVAYPASLNNRGNVTDPSGNASALVRTPLAWLYRPVSTQARLGTQMLFTQKQFSNTAPSRASRSMFGVRPTSLP
jgi:hypothetical protein